MKKMEIVQALRETENLDRHQAHRIVNLFFDSIAQSLKAGDPKTGEKVIVKEKRMPVVRVGLELRERVNS